MVYSVHCIFTFVTCYWLIESNTQLIIKSNQHRSATLWVLDATLDKKRATNQINALSGLEKNVCTTTRFVIKLHPFVICCVQGCFTGIKYQNLYGIKCIYNVAPNNFLLSIIHQCYENVNLEKSDLPESPDGLAAASLDARYACWHLYICKKCVQHIFQTLILWNFILAR